MRINHDKFPQCTMKLNHTESKTFITIEQSIPSPPFFSFEKINFFEKRVNFVPGFELLFLAIALWFTIISLQYHCRWALKNFAYLSLWLQKNKSNRKHYSHRIVPLAITAGYIMAAYCKCSKILNTSPSVLKENLGYQGCKSE